MTAEPARRMRTAPIDFWLERWLPRPPGRLLAGALVGGLTGAALLLPAGLFALCRLLLGLPVLSPTEASTMGDPLHFAAGYALSFAAGGAVYGLLWPWRRTRLSAVLGGIATTVPVLLGLGALFDPEWTLLHSPGLWVVAGAGALVTGPMLGLQLRDMGQDELSR